MEHGVVVVIIPDQVPLSSVVMENRAVIIPARLCVVARLDDPLPTIIRGSERQPLERDVNRTLYRDGLTIIDEPLKAKDGDLQIQGL